MRAERLLIAPALACALLAGAAQSQPAPDPLSDLGRDASAVFDPGPDGSLLLSETDHGVTATRMLKVGDDYRDGWKIEAIGARSATLSKAGQTRTVVLTGLPPSPGGRPDPASGPI